MKLAIVKEFPLLVTFMCGMLALFLLMLFGTLLDKYPIVALIIDSGVLILAGVLGCIITPDHPYRAASIVVIGVFIGIIIHIIIFPTINGFERNLFPLEIVAFTSWAAILCFPTAAIWKHSNLAFKRDALKRAP